MVNSLLHSTAVLSLKLSGYHLSCAVAVVLTYVTLVRGFSLSTITISPTIRAVSSVALYVSNSDSESSVFDGNSLLIFGNGNVANAVMTELENMSIAPTSFKNIFCTYRSLSRDEVNNYQIISENRITYIPFCESSKFVGLCSHILITIPPIVNNEGKTGNHYIDPILDCVGSNPCILDNILSDAFIGYVSTTGVYGNHNNSWVEEKSPTLCKSDSKASAYLDIENRWGEAARMGTRTAFIFRCAGLYGHNLSALHTVRKNGSCNLFLHRDDHVVKESEGTTSRVHLKDVGRAIVACMEKNKMASTINIVNLADSCPAKRSHVMQYACELLEESKAISPMSEKKIKRKHGKSSERRRRRNQDRKRVMNERMKEILAVYGGLSCPSYKEGLKFVLEGNIKKWKIEDNNNNGDSDSDSDSDSDGIKSL
eukprot:CAMPEP_0194081588 /NCGR_PEP_ID=MMETSP0149-20130528/7323_1 /TAXON_ID=122233 /ORGANISM="Chaetoceros debilis, Strain MM31A-1" /LENGTH=425 /DNA_ID=CAMNT_0038763527 /DNA_START=37 /DNA_END=1314 /DNA_ORIENTATION=+